MDRPVAAVEPEILGHGIAFGVEPVQIGENVALVGRFGVKAGGAARIRLPAQTQEASRRLPQIALPRGQIPIHPGQLVVLAIGVVVAFLSSPKFVAGGDHGGSGGEDERPQEVAHGLAPLCFDGAGRIGRAFESEVPGEVVCGPVAIVLAVGLVVLGVVGDEVVQRESVVGRYEIDRGVHATAAGQAPMAEKISRSGQPRRYVSQVAAAAAVR